MPSHLPRILAAFFFLVILGLGPTEASHISGIRITQTGNTGLMINVDVTAFYTTGSTETTAYLGTYYNQVPAMSWGDGSTVPRYGYGSSTGIPLVSTSTVVNGIPARAYRGSFSHSYGSPGNYTISANTRCCPLTTPTYTLVSGSIVTTTVTTSGPFGPTTFTTSFVQNTLAVNAVAPGFAKAFAPNSVAVNTASTLTFTIDNTASTLDDNALDFTDNLPAGLVVAATPNVVNTCTGGTVTAVAGSGTISYTGGLVSAGATCTLSVDVSAANPGTYVNTSGDLTSAFGNSGTASDTVSVFAPAGFTKAFSPSAVALNATSTLTFNIDNSANPVAASAMAFTDSLPAGTVVATPANVVNSCAGTVTAADGSGSISLAGGMVGVGGTCSISVDIEATATGDSVNTSGDLTSSVGNSGTASDTLQIFEPAGFTKTFAPDVVGVGTVATLTFDIDNSANTVVASALAFTDNLPAGMVVATPANVVNSCGGSVTAADGSASISLSGGTTGAGTTCSLAVDVEATAAGDLVNTSGDLTSSVGNSGTATDTLSANPVPGFTKEFNPIQINLGEVSTLTFTIDHSAGTSDATGLAFTDNLPAGMEVADPANVVDTCTGGTVTANPGDPTITYAGGTVAAGSICVISVDITITSSGEFMNVADALMSIFGASPAGTAAAVLSGGTILDVPTASGIGLVTLIGILGLLALVMIRRRH